jgi:hypothetical protein
MNLFKNLSLEDLQGEYWVDVFGFDGIYEVSNFGRFKSLQREVKTRWGTPRVMETKILKQSINKRKTIVDERIEGLNISLGGKTLNSAKMTFISFNKNVDFGKNECVMHLDKITTNNNIENLQKATRKESKSVDIIKSKRTIISIPKNLEKANIKRFNHYKDRTHKTCNCCNENKELNLFIKEHNLCKKCYNKKQSEKRQMFVETKKESKCIYCSEIKPIEQFIKYNNKKCKNCNNKMVKEKRNAKNVFITNN